jgi:hypothetical protein
MKILIDVETDKDGTVIARHWLHTDIAPWNMITHPTIPGQLIDIPAFLKLVSNDPVLMAKTGYHAVSKLSTETRIKSRWDIIVEALNGPDSEPALQALAIR